MVKVLSCLFTEYREKSKFMGNNWNNIETPPGVVLAGYFGYGSDVIQQTGSDVIGKTIIPKVFRVPSDHLSMDRIYLW